MKHWSMKLRLALLTPFISEWNAWVRDYTAQLEMGAKLTFNAGQPIWTRARYFDTEAFKNQQK